MATKDDAAEPVTEFIRELIARWEASGRKLYMLADEAKLARSMPSQIKARTSAASFYSATKLARPLGFTDLPDLVSKAYAWWQSADRSTLPGPAVGSARAEAIRLAQSYGVTTEQVARVLERYPLEEYEHLDELWWLARFHEARTEDAERAAAKRAAEHRKTHADASIQRRQAEVRAAKDQLTEALARQGKATRRKPLKAG